MDISTPLSMAKSLSQVPDALHRGASKERAKATADDFEAVFISNMLGQMFAGVPTRGLFHAGQAEETWRGMLINEYGKSIVKSGGIGLSDAVYKQLVKTQEGVQS